MSAPGTNDATAAPQPGHNSGIAAGRLRSFVERIERLEEEKAKLASDIREVYAEAKSHGFDTKTLRQVVRLRKLDDAERQEQEALLDLYKHALGMLADTPLGESALARIADASARVELKDGDGKVLFNGTAGEFHRAAKRIGRLARSSATMRILDGPEEPFDGDKLLAAISLQLGGGR